MIQPRERIINQTSQRYKSPDWEAIRLHFRSLEREQQDAIARQVEALQNHCKRLTPMQALELLYKLGRLANESQEVEQALAAQLAPKRI